MSEVFVIESLDLEARGVARRDGKVVFVEGALPGERVSAHLTKRKPSFDIARLDHILDASPHRVDPFCPYFGKCGGCSMQHLEASAQVAIKQRVLEDAFSHIGKLRPARMLAPLHGPTWGYRHRARLSVRAVIKQGRVLVGFRERGRHFVTDMAYCPILTPHVSDMLMPLRALIQSLSAPDRIPQIEVSAGDPVTALLLRHLAPLSAADLALLKDFGVRHDVSWWLQAKGPETIHPLIAEDAGKLAYLLPEFGLRMPYRPGDFTQVNDAVNRSLISTAVSLLGVQGDDRVIDLFCGLGNFTLPLAIRAASAVGIEGSKTLTDRAAAAAVLNGLQDRARFITLNLFDVDTSWLRDLGYFDRMLIDPPREGAEAVARALAGLPLSARPKKIVYISCSPATLARDAGILVHEGGYSLDSAGVINMFAHTGHVESIAVFS